MFRVSRIFLLNLFVAATVGVLAPAWVAAEPPVTVAKLASESESSFWDSFKRRRLRLKSSSVIVLDQAEGHEVYTRKADEQRPIASLTKLMTAMVLLDAKLPMDEQILITKQDKDRKRWTKSRLKFGTKLTRGELLRLALMSSENRAAAALGRTYPGGTEAFVVAMNRKAMDLGLNDTWFVDATGLDAGNISTARDLARMADSAYAYPAIRKLTTTKSAQLEMKGRREPLKYSNTNRLIKNRRWDIGLSKTGFIREAGRCLVMQTTIAERPLIIVLLNSWGKLTPMGDSNRIRDWIERGLPRKTGKSV